MHYIYNQIPFTQFRRPSLPQTLNTTSFLLQSHPSTQSKKTHNQTLQTINHPFHHPNHLPNQIHLSQKYNHFKKNVNFPAKYNNKQKNKNNTTNKESNSNKINKLISEKDINDKIWQNQYIIKASHNQNQSLYSFINKQVIKIVETTIMPFFLNRFKQLQNQMESYFKVSQNSNKQPYNHIKTISSQKQKNTQAININIENIESIQDYTSKNSKQLSQKILILDQQSSYFMLESKQKQMNNQILKNMNFTKDSTNFINYINQQISNIKVILTSISQKANRQISELKNCFKQIVQKINKINYNCHQQKNSSILLENIAKMQKIIRVYNNNFISIEQRLCKLEKKKNFSKELKKSHT